MNSISKNYKLLALFVACFCFASLANADYIVFRPGDPLGQPAAIGGAEVPDASGLSENAVAVSWNQTAAFQNVFIDVFNLQNLDATDADDVMTVNFFLRNALDGVNIGTDSVTVTGTDVSNGQLFTGTGLTLNSGTYFLIASAPAFNGAWLFGVPLDPLESTNANASFRPEYLRTSGNAPPDNPAFLVQDELLGFGYAVSGDPTGGGGGAEVPEPASWLLMTTSLFALGAYLRRRRLS